MIPSSTIDDLAVKFAVDFNAPLKTTNEAPVTTRSLIIKCLNISNEPEWEDWLQNKSTKIYRFDIVDIWY